jgi:ATP-binding cassette subfamily B protein
MRLKKIRENLPKPKMTFDRVGQIVFTLREVTKLAMQIQPRLLLTAIILSALWGFLAVPGFYLQKLILDKLVSSIGASDIRPALISIGTIMGTAILLSLFRNFLSSYNGFLRRSLSRYFEAYLGIIIGNKLAELDMATIDDPKFQDRFSKIEKESGRRAWGLMVPLLDIPNYLVGFISSLGVIIFLSPLIALGVFVVSLPQIFINSKYIKEGYKLYTEQSYLRRMWGWLEMYIFRNRNIMELKLLKISSYLSKKLKKVVSEILGQRLELNKKRELSRFGSLVPLSLFELAISVLLIFWVIIRKITIGSFQLYISSLRNAEQSLTSMVSSFLEIYENYIYVNDLVWFLGLESQLETSKGNKVGADTKISLQFDNIWFRYTSKLPWVLKNISFKIKAGERIAIVGENGAGKTTLMKLITRFYDPQKGKIFINGGELSDINVDNWRSQFAVLYQQFEKYPFSVRESIGFGNVKEINNIKMIKKVAKETGVDDYIESLPLKYDNPLTPRFEEGVDPSTGQWQRIGIARVLFKRNAKIMILDEPTSNVDPEAEEKIFQQLVKLTKDKILFFVTQRFSTVRVADRILVMHNGEIVEQGTHRQLLEKDGKYKKMYNLQAQAYLENSDK